MSGFFTRPRPLLFYLITLCAALSLPVLTVAGLMTWRFAESEKVRLKSDIDDVNEQLVFALERLHNADVAVMRALATSTALRDGNIASFTSQAIDLIHTDLPGARIILQNADDSGTLLDTSPRNDKDPKPIDTLHRSISGFVPGTTFARSGYQVTVPVILDNKIKYYLVGRLPLYRLQRIIREQNLDQNYFASIVDRNGIILARSADSEKYAGRRLPGVDEKQPDHFTWSGNNPQGVAVYGVFRRLASSRWGVSTGVSEDALHAPLYRSLGWLTALAVFVLSISCFLAWMLTQIVSRATQALAETAGRLGDGVDIAAPVTAVREANIIGAAMTSASRKLRQQAAALTHAKAELEERVERRTRELGEKTNLLETTLANMDQDLMVVDEAGFIQLANTRAAELIDLPKALLDGHPNIADNLKFQKDRGDFDELPDDIKIMFARDLIAGRTLVHERERPDGRVMEVRTVPLPDKRLVRTYTDVTLRKHAERHLQHLARHDPLTDLPNRVHLRERLEQAIASSERHAGSFAVLSLDLDRFKHINDLYGHAIGDGLLIEVAKRFKSALRMEDTVARLGGDEFVIIQTAVTDEESPLDLARRLLRAISGNYSFDGTAFEIGVSIGVAIYPTHGRNADEIMKNADAALYQAKRSGRNRFCLFETAPSLRQAS